MVAADASASGLHQAGVPAIALTPQAALQQQQQRQKVLQQQLELARQRAQQAQLQAQQKGEAAAAKAAAKQQQVSYGAWACVVGDRHSFVHCHADQSMG